MKEIFLILFASIVTTACTGELKPFKSDGCSAFPDGTLEQNTLWLRCCVEHDVRYWQGGTYQERMHADTELHSCVSDIGEPEIAVLMLAGVRVGGTPFLPTQFRWGYGWPFLRGYKSLTDDELALVRESMRNH